MSEALDTFHMSCPFKQAKKTVSLQVTDAVSVQNVFSSNGNFEQPLKPEMCDNDRQYSAESIEQNIENNIDQDNAEVKSDVSPEESFLSALEQQSKALYEEMKYDCDVIEQKIGVN
jgi:hypothetical protein